MNPPEIVLLDRSEVEQLARISRSRIYDLMDQGRFPRPVKISTRCVRWHKSEILEWIAGLPRSTGAAS